VSQASLEVELKLAAGDDEPLRHLAGAPALGPAALGPARHVAETDRYLDTASRRLAAAGWACRLRSRGPRTIMSLKGPAEHRMGEALHRRPEIEGPEAERRAAELAGGQRLLELVRLEQARITRAVTRNDTPIGDLWLDRCRIVAGGRTLGQLRVVELELAGTEAGAQDVLAALLAVPGLAPDPLSKLEHALALLEGRA